MGRLAYWAGWLIAVAACVCLAAGFADDLQLHPLKARGTTILGRVA